VYRALDGRAILVGREQGELWAVELPPGPESTPEEAAHGVFSEQDYERFQDLAEEGARGPLDDALPFEDEAGDRRAPVGHPREREG
jgi:hypothetical protein